jgi:hypothetical protein
LLDSVLLVLALLEFVLLGTVLLELALLASVLLAAAWAIAKALHRMRLANSVVPIALRINPPDLEAFCVGYRGFTSNQREREAGKRAGDRPTVRMSTEVGLAVRPKFVRNTNRTSSS